MHSKMVDEEKKGALKELISQMYQKMCEGGEGHEAGESMGEELAEHSLKDIAKGGDEEMSLKDKIADSMGIDTDSDLDDEEKMNFMKRGNKMKTPVKGSVVMMSLKSKMPMKKKMKG